jgi:hypothetical protein
VQNWSGTATTGTPLFTAAGSTSTVSGAHAFTFTPGINLTAGAVYILYFSTVGAASALTSNASFGATSSDTYAGGSFFYSNVDSTNPTTGSISDLNGTAWSTAGIRPDLAFSASFAAPSTGVPEPGAASLFLAGIAAVIGARLRLGR